jgi:hypothetical protein
VTDFQHLGPDLTAEQVQALPDGAEIMITWGGAYGGNGPWPRRVLVDKWGWRLGEGLYCDPLLSVIGDERWLVHRITAGWPDHARAWHESRIPEPPHIVEQWRQLRGEAEVDRDR